MMISINTVMIQKAKLSHSEKFMSKDKIMYPQFEGMLQAKLKIDDTVIESEREKI